MNNEQQRDSVGSKVIKGYYCFAQFVNEFTSVYVPLSTLNIGCAIGLGALAGGTTFVTSIYFQGGFMGKQVVLMQERISRSFSSMSSSGISLPERGDRDLGAADGVPSNAAGDDEARDDYLPFNEADSDSSSNVNYRAADNWLPLISGSIWLMTILQWYFNTVFLYVTMKSWHQNGQNGNVNDIHGIEPIEWGIIAVAYLMIQFLYDLCTDAMQSTAEIAKQRNMENPAKLYASCLGGFLTAESKCRIGYWQPSVHGTVRFMGSLSNMLGRLVPIIYWIPRAWSFYNILGISAAIFAFIGMPVFLQNFFFEGKYVKEAGNAMMGRTTPDQEPWIKPWIAKLAIGFLCLGGLLDGLDAALAPREFALSLKWPLWAVWALPILAGVGVMIGTYVSEVGEAIGEVQAQTKSTPRIATVLDIGDGALAARLIADASADSLRTPQ